MLGDDKPRADGMVKSMQISDGDNSASSQASQDMQKQYMMPHIEACYQRVKESRKYQTTGFESRVHPCLCNDRALISSSSNWNDLIPIFSCG